VEVLRVVDFYRLFAAILLNLLFFFTISLLLNKKNR